MNFVCCKIISYLFIIHMAIDSTMPKPIVTRKEESSAQVLTPNIRFSRQVVQPKWLNFGIEPYIDPTVHVNKQALLEAAEIRQTIRKAQEKGTNFASNEQKVTNKTMRPLLTPPPPRVTNVANPVHVLTNFNKQMQKFWQILAHNFFNLFRSKMVKF